MCNEAKRKLEEQISNLESELRLAKTKINEIIAAIKYGSGQPNLNRFESVGRINNIEPLEDEGSESHSQCTGT